MTKPRPIDPEIRKLMLDSEQRLREQGFTVDPNLGDTMRMIMEQNRNRHLVNEHAAKYRDEINAIATEVNFANGDPYLNLENFDVFMSAFAAWYEKAQLQRLKESLVRRMQHSATGRGTSEEINPQ